MKNDPGAPLPATSIGVMENNSPQSSEYRKESPTLASDQMRTASLQLWDQGPPFISPTRQVPLILLSGQAFTASQQLFPPGPVFYPPTCQVPYANVFPGPVHQQGFFNPGPPYMYMLGVLPYMYSHTPVNYPHSSNFVSLPSPLPPNTLDKLPSGKTLCFPPPVPQSSTTLLILTLPSTSRTVSMNFPEPTPSLPGTYLDICHYLLEILLPYFLKYLTPRLFTPHPLENISTETTTQFPRTYPSTSKSRSSTTDSLFEERTRAKNQTI